MKSFRDFQDDCDDAGLDARQCSEHHWQIIDQGRILVNFWPTTGKILSQNAKPKTKARMGKAADAIALAEIIVSGKQKPASSPRQPQSLPAVKGHHNDSLVYVKSGEVVASKPARATLWQSFWMLLAELALRMTLCLVPAKHPDGWRLLKAISHWAKGGDVQ